MKFLYQGFDKAGRNVRDAIDAADAADATDQLRKRGVFVVSVREAGADAARAPDPAGRGLLGRGGARIADLVSMMRQLSVLVSTGTPLVEALVSIEQQTPVGKWRGVLADVRQRVEEGAQLSSAMGHHPRCFDPICRSLVAAGEHGGGLDSMLLRLAELLRQQQRVRRMIAGAMVYPCLLICVSIGVLSTMVGFVLPRFKSLFEGLGTPLPPSTKILMDLSDALRENWMYAVATLVLAGVALPLWLSSPGGRAAIDAVAVKGPQIGKVFRGYATARLARLLGVLLEGKVPLLEALELVRQSCTNTYYLSLLTRAVNSVTKGDTLTSVFTGSSLLGASLVDAMRSGERSGRMGSVLLTMADYMDEDNDIALKAITSLIEPLILLFLGVVVGAMAISMFLPLFDLAAAGPNAGGGGGGAE